MHETCNFRPGLHLGYKSHMGALSKILRSIKGPAIGWWCPGCDEAHAVPVGEGGWKWNGDAEAPTLDPSVDVTSGHFTPGFKPGDPCWCAYNADLVASGEEPCSFKCSKCHTFVRGGRIEFLADCTHALKGQTVPIPPWPL